jgi:hypothetical protein
MGMKLSTYYDYALQKGGLTLQMRLAMKTGLPSNQAAKVMDAPDTLEKFRAALVELTNDANVPKL